jgi:hypothetical protein
MSIVRVTASAMIEAPAGEVYSILSDYDTHHPAILPKEYFPAFRVEEGGVGEGTQISFDLRLLGRTHASRARIEEPQPGRVLVERVLDERETVTRFVVDAAGERRCRVTIHTEWNSSGVRAWVERLVAVPMLQRIYRLELRNLALYSAGGTRTIAPADGIP